MDSRLTLALAELEKAMLLFPAEDSVEVMINLKVHDDIPDGFVEEQTGMDATCVSRVISAVGGSKKKTISLYIPN